VWAGGRKLAGVLLESRACPEPVVIVGIGVNVRPPAGGWPGGLRVPATSLADWGDDRTAGAVLTSILARLEAAYDRYLREGFRPFLAVWRERSVLDGRLVQVEEGGRSFRARVESLDEQGRLVAVTPDGVRRALRSGEVHLLLEETP
jgi:BirA family biotin operon repressor/biotin-[acetyl-CoA-carboxylase] ligase